MIRISSDDTMSQELAKKGREGFHVCLQNVHEEDLRNLSGLWALSKITHLKLRIMAGIHVGIIFENLSHTLSTTWSISQATSTCNNICAN